LKVGLDFSHSGYEGYQQFSPVDIVGISGSRFERIEFGAPNQFSVNQSEFAWFVGDHWTVSQRLTFDFGLRFAPVFPLFPDRTIQTFDPANQLLSSTLFSNVIPRGLANPRSET